MAWLICGTLVLSKVSLKFNNWISYGGIAEAQRQLIGLIAKGSCMLCTGREEKSVDNTVGERVHSEKKSVQRCNFKNDYLIVAINFSRDV